MHAKFRVSELCSFRRPSIAFLLPKIRSQRQHIRLDIKIRSQRQHICLDIKIVTTGDTLKKSRQKWNCGTHIGNPEIHSVNGS